MRWDCSGSQRARADHAQLVAVGSVLDNGAYDVHWPCPTHTSEQETAGKHHRVCGSRCGGAEGLGRPQGTSPS